MSHLRPKMTIWIDLDNSPHVPFFVPIIKELEERGYAITLTARDTFQVLGLADRYKLKYEKVGRHYGANKLLKIIGTLWRAVQLVPVVLKHKPGVSLSHGSRPLILLSTVLRIPTILLFDYEHAKSLTFVKPTLGVAPEVVGDPRLNEQFRRGLRLYSGIKEDVYVPSFKVDTAFRQQLNIDDDEILVTIRPPASEAHYHKPESDALFVEVVEYLGRRPGIRMVILPRNEKTEKKLISRRWPKWCAERKIIIPDHVVDGLNLIWHSDLVISGGGTMNREAAALGVPVYSIFRGSLGAVDKYLCQQGRLVLIEDVADVESKIRLVKSTTRTGDRQNGTLALQQILSAIESVADMGGATAVSLPDEA